MIMRNICRSLRRVPAQTVCVVSVILAACSVATAQEATSQPVAAEAGLADRQSLIRDRVARLEDRMYQLSQALKKSEPQKAARLLEGLSHVRGEQIRERMEKIVERLRTENLSDAGELQAGVIQDLQGLLKELVEEPDQLKERKSEIERLEAARKALEELTKEQEHQREAAEEMKAAGKRAEALEAAAERVRNLVERQKASAEKTRQSGNLSSEAKEQAEIRGETESVAREVGALADAAEMAGDQSSEDEKQSAEKSESDGADTPPEAGGDSKSPDANRARDAAEALSEAGKSMESAEQSLRVGDRAEAGDQQDKAAQDLEKSLKTLEDEVKKLRNKLKLEEISEEQKKTAEKTKSLGEQMGGDAKGGKSAGEGSKEDSSASKESAESTDEKSGEQSGDDTPGKKNVEEAVPHQQSAADKLKEGDTEKAVQEQEKALEELKKAQEELEQRLDQLRKEQQEEFLAALESRFKGMLARQLDCNKSTNRLAELGQANWKRSDQLELADLSQKQRWVGDQADEALFLLTEDGTTVILPQLITQVRDDAREAADRLGAADAGDTVRAIQAELELVLRDIIDAIEQKQEEMQKNDENGGGGDSGNQPLLPGSAELKLLRSCQLRVNSATERLRGDREKPDAVANEIIARLKKLSERQDEVAKMAREMHEALQKAQ